jgi:lipid-A-disaccharide synthase-like uncharacterized protein/uncharacterized protein with PQ loop repeat
MLLGETISLVFGMSNLVIWFGIALPQIYKNYKNGSSKAVSYLFYYKLLVGGIISLSIALIKQTSVTVIYVGVHHTLITMVLMSQLLYYRFKPKYIRLNWEESYENESEQEVGLSFSEIMTTIIVTPAIVILLVIVVITRNIILIETLAWIANILFTTSKFTQIYINYDRRSTEGLSKFSFICMIFTDLCFIASILVNGIDKPIADIIIRNIQWLFSCTISLSCGLIILGQFKLYEEI